MISYKEKAETLYQNSLDKLRNKAIAAGKAMDNAMKLEYSVGGTTNCHFMIDNYLKYFDYEKIKNLK